MFLGYYYWAKETTADYQRRTAKKDFTNQVSDCVNCILYYDQIYIIQISCNYIYIPVSDINLLAEIVLE